MKHLSQKLVPVNFAVGIWSECCKYMVFRENWCASCADVITVAVLRSILKIDVAVCAVKSSADSQLSRKQFSIPM